MSLLIVDGGNAGGGIAMSKPTDHPRGLLESTLLVYLLSGMEPVVVLVNSESLQRVIQAGSHQVVCNLAPLVNSEEL